MPKRMSAVLIRAAISVALVTVGVVVRVADAPDAAAAVGGLYARDARAVEGDNGAKLITFRVDRTSAASAPATVVYFAIGGSAKTTEDFVQVAGLLVFPPGVTSQQVRVPVRGDTKVEPDERYHVILTENHGAPIGDQVGDGTIVTDD